MGWGAIYVDKREKKEKKEKEEEVDESADESPDDDGDDDDGTEWAVDVSAEAQARRAAEQLTDASRAMVTVADMDLPDAPPTVEAAGTNTTAAKLA